MPLVDSVANLYQSGNARGSAPGGNVHFNQVAGALEVITVEELASFVITDVGHPNYTDGVTPFANPISDADGITFRVLLEFEAQERLADETLRQYDKYLDGSFKRAGAGKVINARKFSTTGSNITDDRKKVRGYGWIEYDLAGAIDQIWFGAFALDPQSSIQADHQSYIQNALDGAITNATYQGATNEPFLVFDAAGADNTAYFALSLRPWAYVHTRSDLASSGLTDAHGLRGSFGLATRPHPFYSNVAGFLEAEVFGGGQIAPYTGMGFQSRDTARTETGLVGTGPYEFSFEILNAGNGSLSELVAFCDALVRQDLDVDDHGTNSWNGKQQPTLYTLTADGKARFMQGLFPVGIPVADQADVVLVTDSGEEVTYESVAGGVIKVGAVAAADADCWYHMFYQDPPGADDAFGESGTITVNDAAGDPIKGLVGGLTEIPFDFAYSANTQGGYAANTDRPIVIEVEGRLGAGAKKVLETIINSTTLSFVCEPPVQDNI